MFNMTIFLSSRIGGMFPSLIRLAKPYTICVFPTPPSPINMTLFLFFLPRTSIISLISFSRPIVGEDFFDNIHSLISVVNCFIKVDLPLVIVFLEPTFPFGCISLSSFEESYVMLDLNDDFLGFFVFFLSCLTLIEESSLLDLSKLHLLNM